MISVGIFNDFIFTVTRFDVHTIEWLPSLSRNFYDMDSLIQKYGEETFKYPEVSPYCVAVVSLTKKVNYDDKTYFSFFLLFQDGKMNIFALQIHPNTYALMKAKSFVFCMFVFTLLASVSLISCGNSSKAKVENESSAQVEENFQSFLKKFTSSAAYQYTRIKFPLKTPITLLTDDGNSEKTFPFTKEKWPLLDEETLKEERITQEEGGIYVSKFTLNEPKHKTFEAGYEESEIDLRVEFELQADGKWYVVDCYTGWYGYDLPIGELKKTIQDVQEENAAFKEMHP